MTLSVEIAPVTINTVELAVAESGFSVELSLAPIGAKGDVGDVNPANIAYANQASAAAAAAADSEAAAASSAAIATQKAAEAASSASAAALITYGNLIMHPKKITESINIPDGFNAFLVDPVEIGPNVTVTGLGNSTLRGI